MEHDAAQHGFDLRAFAKKASLDDYGVIRVINYIRAEVQAGRDPRPTLAAGDKEFVPCVCNVQHTCW